MTEDTMTHIDIRISSLKGVPSALLAQLDDLFDREFGKEPTVYSDSDWFVMGFVERRLVSRVGILKRVVSVGDDVVVVGGISGVTTLAGYRKHGYGTALMRSAQQFLKDELPASFGLLICNARVKQFYERLGWREVAGPTTYAQPRGSETCKGLTMVLECGREWPAGPIDLCGYPW